MKKKLCSLLFYFGCITVSNAQMNVLFIESDDQSNQTVQAYGNKKMITPNIDALASEGVSFTAAYNMGCWSPAVCIPSRTMLFYGKYLWESQNINKQNSPKALSEEFKDNGYYTFMTGKWHAMGKNATEVFDQTGSIQPGQLKTYNAPAGHITDITANEAVAFLKNYNEKKPFFAYVAFNAPHVPRQTEQKYYDLYPTESTILPPSMVDKSPFNPNVKYQYTSNPIRAAEMKKTVQQNNAMVTHMDTRIGEIIQALKDKNLYDKTIIVYTSDHGINFGENAVAGKVCLYEPSVTAPLIIKAPKIAANSKIDQRVYLQDIGPTLTDMLGFKNSKDSKFQSLIPIITKKGKARESIYLAMFDDQRAIIAKNKKLIVYPKTADLEYYDLIKDPWETNNLIKATSSKTNIKLLLKQLKDWQAETKDLTDLSPIYNQYLN